MQKLLLIFCLFLISPSANSQVTFTYEDKQLTLLQQLPISNPVVFDAPITSTDHEWIKLFKSYFHPADLNAYKQFFPSSEWIEMSNEKFMEWQTRIANEKLYLEHVVHVKAADKREYLVFQYIMEKPQFTLAKSTIMMKNEGEWKYINFQKNEYVDMLKQLGRVDSKYLSSLPTEKPTGIALAQVHPYKLRADKDKFDRNVVFEKISEVLSARGVSESDMEFARHLFLDRDDRNLVDHISASYKWDHIDLMNEINEECGFRLYNFVRNSETR